MMKLRRQPIIQMTLTLALVFFSCTGSSGKLPVYRSVPLIKSADKAEELVAVNYDKNAKLLFGTASDDSLFFLRVVFVDQGSLMKLMRGGLMVFFDPSGKKKKNYCLKLERTEMQREGMNRMPEGNRTGEPDPRIRNPFGATDQLLTKATWTKNGHTLAFNRTLSKVPIRSEFLKNGKGEVVFELTLPLSEMELEKGQQIFSVGIETGVMQMSGNPGGGSRPGGMSGGGRGGMEGGRMGGGSMGGGGMGGGGSMGGSRPSGSGSPDMTPLKLWFMVEI